MRMQGLHATLLTSGRAHEGAKLAINWLTNCASVRIVDLPFWEFEFRDQFCIKTCRPACFLSYRRSVAPMGDILRCAIFSVDLV